MSKMNEWGFIGPEPEPRETEPVPWDSYRNGAREIVSRKRAKELGLTQYFTGKPCVNGHTTTRFVQSCNCFACNMETRRALREDKPEFVERERCADRARRDKANARRRERRQARVARGEPRGN